MGGRKTFVTNTVLTAADVQDFLMDQAVMVFADSAARGSAIASPTEGMVAYLNDSNLMTIYDGANWKTSLATTGSVLQVITATSSTSVTSTSTSFITTGLTALITPRATSSRILCLVSVPVMNNGSSTASIYTLFRGTVAGTNLGSATNPTFAGFGQAYNASSQVRAIASWNFVDSPNTTSETRYTVGFNPQSGGAEVMQEGRLGNLTLMEIAG
jgi:hypothetical protein